MNVEKSSSCAAKTLLMAWQHGEKGVMNILDIQNTAINGKYFGLLVYI